jgi:ketosteroid isomerase-like protein
LFPLPTAGPLFTISKWLFTGRTNLSLGFGVIAHMFILLEYYNFVFFAMILSMLNSKQLKELVLKSFEMEKNKDPKANKELLHPDFAVTEITEDYDGTVFRRLEGPKLMKYMEMAFETTGREYEFKNVIADEQSQTVVVEFVESYPDEKTGKTFRTPQVSICEVKDGKLYRTRHYLDPRLSYKYLDKSDIDRALT